MRQFITAASASAPLSEIAKILRVSQVPVRTVTATVLSYANAELVLSKAAFLSAFEPFVLANTETKRAHVLLEHLFKLFDVDGNGFVDAAELCAGLSVLCAGSVQDQLVAAFEALDINHQGFISIDEIYVYLVATLKVLMAVDGVDGVDVEALAKQRAVECFREADTNRDGKITFDEFVTWYNRAQGPAAEAEFPQPQPPQLQRSGSASSGASGFSTPQLDQDSLAAVRRLAGLAPHAPEDVFEHFARYADGDGRLTLESYLDAFSLFVPASARTQAELTEAHELRVMLFALFDRERKYIADFGEVMSGLSVLCAGTRESKLAAAYTLLSTRDDDGLSIDELQLYLSAVFRVLFFADKSLIDAIGLSADDLATQTVVECYSDAGLSPEAPISLDVSLRRICWFWS